jgi:hypothetical protein
LDEGDEVTGGAAKREPAQPQHADYLRFLKGLCHEVNIFFEGL